MRKNKEDRSIINAYRFTEDVWNALYGRFGNLGAAWEIMNHPNSIINFLGGVIESQPCRGIWKRRKPATAIRIVTLDEEFRAWSNTRSGRFDVLLKEYADSLSDEDLNRLHVKNGMTKNYLLYGVRAKVLKLPDTNLLDIGSRDRFLQKVQAANPEYPIWMPKMLDPDGGEKFLLNALRMADYYFTKGIGSCFSADIPKSKDGSGWVGIPLLLNFGSLEKAVITPEMLPLKKLTQGLDVPVEAIRSLLEENGMFFSNLSLSERKETASLG